MEQSFEELLGSMLGSQSERFEELSDEPAASTSQSPDQERQLTSRRPPCARCIAVQIRCYWTDSSSVTCVPCGKKREACPGDATWMAGSGSTTPNSSHSTALVSSQYRNHARNGYRSPSSSHRSTPYRSQTPTLSSRSPSASISRDFLRDDLSMSLLRVFQSHFGHSAPGLRPGTILRLATTDTHPTVPSSAKNAMILAAMSLASRSSDHPLVIGRSQPLITIDGEATELPDLDAFGVSRRSVTASLIRNAHRSGDLVQRDSIVGIETCILLAYMLLTNDNDTEGARRYFVQGIFAFRKLRAQNVPGFQAHPSVPANWWAAGLDLEESKNKIPYGLWFYLSMYDAFTAAAGRVPLEISDEELRMQFPRLFASDLMSTFGKKTDMFSQLLASDTLASIDVYDDEMLVQEFEHGGRRLLLMRQIAKLLLAPPKDDSEFMAFRNTFQAMRGEFSEATVILGQGWEAKQEAIRTQRDGLKSRSEYVLNGETIFATLTTSLPAMVHSRLRQWIQRDQLKPEYKPLVTESERVLRSAMRLAAETRKYIPPSMRHHVTLARMSCHLELDPEWLDIMVKRYDDAPEDFGSPEEELSMDELQFFVRALRIASWSYSVAGQRLRELQNAMLELRDRETAKVELAGEFANLLNFDLLADSQQIDNLLGL